MFRTITGLTSAGVLAVGLLTAPAGQAAPSGCTFPATVTINISDGSAMTFSANGATVNGPTTIGAPGAEGTPGALQGSVSPTGHVSLTFIHGANDERTFVGDAGDDATARGSVAPSGLTWETSGPLTCAQKQKTQPTVTSDKVLGGIVIHVKNNNADTTACHYDSEVVDRDFTLNPNATTDLRIVPAVPLGRNWNFSVTCDNDTSTTGTILF
jgi:hypothetical protein